MIVVEGIHRTYRTRSGSVHAVRPLDLDVRAGTLFTLLGPSGCGKTTTLRMLAGLEQPDGGRIAIDDRVVYSATDRIDIPTFRRNIGMVFQSYAVWPHMSVFENVAYPLRVQRLERAVIRDRVGRMLALVGLEGMGSRASTQLSGGQQQRVALARALVPEPSVLLLDEPFSNLDARLRSQMGEELKELQNRIGVTTVYVTHDQQEALALSDVLVVMDHGRVVQQGAPAAVYRQPRTRFAAEFLGRTNLLPARAVAPLRAGIQSVDTEVGSLRVVLAELGARAAHHDLVVSIRPEALALASVLDSPSTARNNGHNVLVGRVERAVFRGDAVDYDVRVGAQPLRVRSAADFAIPYGEQVRLEVAPEHCTLLVDEPSDEGSTTKSPLGDPAEANP